MRRQARNIWLMTESLSLRDLLDPAADEGPVFEAPWQARAFGLVVAFHDEGAGFEWETFQEYLIEEVAAADSEMGPAELLEAAYYEQWLAAFERLLFEEGVLSRDELDARAAEFATEDRTAEEFVAGDRGH